MPRRIAVFGVFLYVIVPVSADCVIALTAVGTCGGAYKPCMQILHGSIIHIAKRGHNFGKTELFCKFRRAVFQYFVGGFFLIAAAC